MEENERFNIIFRKLMGELNEEDETLPSNTMEILEASEEIRQFSQIINEIVTEEVHTYSRA